MFIIGNFSFKFYTHFIIILASALRIRTEEYCIKDEYYNATQKRCLPCTTCASPYIVIATCNVYSNTICGLPSFNKGPYLEVLQEQDSETSVVNSKKDLKPNSHNKIKSKHVERNKNHEKTIQNGTIKNKKHRKKLRKKNDIDIPNYSFSLLNITEKLRIMSSNNEREIKNFKLGNDYNINENEIVKLDTNATIPIVQDSIQRSFFFSYLGKVVIGVIVISINSILIIVLIVKIIKTCYRKKLKDEHLVYSCNQKLPHPSQKPVKCRFTAVLPTKSEYANVEPCTKLEISPTDSTATDPASWVSSCSSTSPSFMPQDDVEAREGLNPLSLNYVREAAVRDPLITSNEVIESANMIQLYSRIPSPNPFTMDRLLENRRAVGCSSVENNLYVETWCSSPSPMLPRSQESSVAPSPALSCIRKVISSSNSSSPLTTRTFRATPAFTSFHPNRS